MESIKFQITFRYPADEDLIKWKQSVPKGDTSYIIREALRKHLKDEQANTPTRRKKSNTKALDSLEML